MENIFKNFEAISNIPRCSGNEKKISDYLVKFARDLGLDVIQEQSFNVIIKKPATKGYQDAKTVILQGHMDMVCTKVEGLEFDFEKDSIELVTEGDLLRANGTTLGADNGIAVAMIMSILEDKSLEHPEVIALITTEEETGMDGVLNLDPKNISGDILINIDSEDEGVALASCAGGVKNVVELPIVWTNGDVEKTFLNIAIKGLLGGHSGIEIDKNRANAIKLLGRLLQRIEEEISVDIVTIGGGEKMNAIAKMAEVTLAVKVEDEKRLRDIVAEEEQVFKDEFAVADSGIFIEINETVKGEKIFDTKTKNSIIDLLRLIPDGVQTMSASIEGLVESSNNIGVLETDSEKIIISNAVRSSVKSLKSELNSRIGTISKLTGAEMKLIADYPEWQYKIDSPIRDLMSQVFKEKFNVELKIDAIHAGLECGFLKEKLGDIDMVSIGPDIRDVHTPNENLSISSTERVYDFLVEVLKKIK